jgi:thiol-disulfide isomerase/thioredoxin
MRVLAVSPLVLVFSLTLAAVFAAAGVAKLLDPRGSREAAKAFGVPERLAGLVARGLPLAEIAIAVLLLPTATRWYAATAALGLLLAFCAAIARVMARGEAPDCHCFGQLHSKPAGWSALGRTGLLAAVAGFIVIAGREDGGASVFGWISRLEGVEWLVLALAVALAAVVAVGGYAVVHVLRSYGKVLVRLEALESRLRAAGFDLEEPDEIPELGLEPGTPAPDFALASTTGERVSLGALRESGNPLLLLFTSPTCEPCSHLMPTVAEWQREHADELTVALLSAGEAEAVRADAAEHGLTNVLLDTDLATYEAYEANGTPSAVLIGDDGTIATWLAAGGDWIESLIGQALAGLGRTPGLPVGTELPELRVSRLDESEVELRDAIERDSLLLFWNPGCGFCRSLHEEILAWEASPPADAPALVVVSAGEAFSVKAESFGSTVLLDPEWAVSSALGADGTPMAVLVTADGRIASGVVGGGPAVLELLVAGELAESH